MNPNSAANASKANANVEPPAKPTSSISFNAGEKSIQKSCPIVRKAVLRAIIRGEVDPDSVIHFDHWRCYNGLVDLGYEEHYRVHHGFNEFSRGKTHINGIESFWSFAKRRLMKFHGVPKATFYLYLKECEFRFNYRNQNLYVLLLKIIRNNPLN